VGSRSVRKSAGLEKRRSILNYVVSHPGQTFGTMRSIFTIPEGTLRYHLETLERGGRIKRMKKDGIMRYYPAGAAVSRMDRTLSSRERRILETVTSNPGITQKDLARITKINIRTLINQLNRLLEEDVLHCEKKGRYTHYYHIPLNEVRYRTEVGVLLESFLRHKIDWSEFKRKKKALKKEFGISER